MNNQDGYILGYPADSWSTVVNAGYLIAVVVAALFSVLVWRISIITGAAKDRALEAYKVQAAVEVAQASARASTAEQKAAEAKQETAVLNIESAQIKAANLRLEQQMAWRRITSDQANFLVSVLKPYAGQQVKTLSVMGDAEGLQYRRDLIVVLKKAGWAEDGSQSLFTNPPMGLQVIVNPADGRPNGSNGGIMLPAALMLASTLFKLKLIPATALGIDPEIPQGTIALLVGVKPPIDTP